MKVIFENFFKHFNFLMNLLPEKKDDDDEKRKKDAVVEGKNYKIICKKDRFGSLIIPQTLKVYEAVNPQSEKKKIYKTIRITLDNVIEKKDVHSIAEILLEKLNHNFSKIETIIIKEVFENESVKTFVFITFINENCLIKSFPNLSQFYNISLCDFYYDYVVKPDDDNDNVVTMVMYDHRLTSNKNSTHIIYIRNYTKFNDRIVISKDIKSYYIQDMDTILLEFEKTGEDTNRTLPFINAGMDCGFLTPIIC